MMIGMLFWAVIGVGAVALLVRAFARPSATTETPLDILKRRLAAGDIDADEFERRRHAIETPSHA